MGATSTEGRGPGAVNPVSTADLSKDWTLSPTIIFTGIFETEEVLSSPPSVLNEVVFPYALIGGPNNYVVMLTTINGGKAYIISRTEDAYGNFTGFTAGVESDCNCMYLVARVGSKAQ